MRKVATFQVDDMGIENTQYFQGYGVSFTSYTDCCYGIGDNPRNALEDCLDQCAERDVDTEDLEARILAENGGKPYPEVPSVSADEPSDLYYHIGIKWTFDV